MKPIEALLARKRNSQPLQQIEANQASLLDFRKQVNNARNLQSLVAYLPESIELSQLPKIKQKIIQKELMKKTSSETDKPFYSTYNYKVLHSQSSDFLLQHTEPTEPVRNRTQSLHQSGSTQFLPDIAASVYSQQQRQRVGQIRPPQFPETRSLSGQRSLLSLKKFGVEKPQLLINQVKTVQKTIQVVPMLASFSSDESIEELEDEDLEQRSVLLPLENSIMKAMKSAKSEKSGICIEDETDATRMESSLVDQLTSRLLERNGSTVDSSQICKAIQKKNNLIKSVPRQEKVRTQVQIRQNVLSNRPKKSLLRQFSAKKRNQDLTSLISHLVHESQSDQAAKVETRQPVIPKEQPFIEQRLEKAAQPRLTQLRMPDESRDFRQTLALLGLKDLWSSSETQAERLMIKQAYEIFIEKLENHKTPRSDKESTDSSESVWSSDSLRLEEDGGPHINSVELSSDSKLLRKFCAAICKKLAKYQEQLNKEIENKEYTPLIENFDIRRVQAALDAPKIAERKAQPLQGSDLPLAALKKIYFTKNKNDRLRAESCDPVKAYKDLLFQGNTDPDSCQPVLLREKPAKNLIKRKFLMLPGDTDLKDVDPDEMIEDPAGIFDDYLQRETIRRQNTENDFALKFKFASLQQQYRFNSTIHEQDPTPEVAYLKACKFNAELALPLLAKITDRELILSNYSVEWGHFASLAEAFKIDSGLLTKITLIDCGIDEQTCYHLFESLTHLASIEHVQIHGGKLGLEALPYLIQLIQRSKGELKSLVFADIQMQPATLQLLLENLQLRCRLTRLHLNNLTISKLAFASFTAYFRNNLYLEELSLQNLSGLAPESWLPFFEALAQNKRLRSLFLQNNNLFEDERKAVRNLFNPYNVFKRLHAKWIKMGPGQKWPQNPLDTLTEPQQLEDFFKRKVIKTQVPSTIVPLPVPEFPEMESQTDERMDTRLLSKSEVEERAEQRHIDQVYNLMVKSLKEAFALSFMKKDRKKLKVKKPDEDSEDEKKPKAKKAQVQEKAKLEYVTISAMTITEAIYKHLRRNQNLQHLDLSQCNLSQVMIGRIGLGVKCSTSLVSVHFSGNPGVTSAVKSFLQVKLKASAPPRDKSGINNRLIEQGAELQSQLRDQLNTNEALSTLAQDTVQIREVKKQLNDRTESVVDLETSETGTLIFTRLLGHKLTIPGSGRWRILTQSDQECWVCHKHQICYFFWGPSQIALSAATQSHGLDSEKLFSKLKEGPEAEEPYIYNKATRWLPEKMMKVDQFALLPRQSDEQPDFMQIIRKKYDLAPGYDDFYDLNRIQQKDYKRMEAEFHKGLKEGWMRQIGAFVKWQQPHFPGFEFHNEAEFTGSSQDFFDLESNPIYVKVALMKPGKNYYCVQFKRNQEDDQQSQGFSEAIEHNENSGFHLHKVIVPCRTEPLPLFLKNMQAQVIEREFVHKSSVFARWKPDTKKAQRLAVENDMLSMNLSKMCRTEQDLASIQRVVEKHWRYLKDCNTDLIADSDFTPYIGQVNFVQFYRECELSDENLKPSNLDLIWTQVQTNDRTRVGQNRGEFIECLIRIAKGKYVDTNKFKPLCDALDRLIVKDVMPKWGDSANHKQRLKHIWTVEVNDLLNVNLAGLKTIYQSFWDKKLVPPKKDMSQSEAENFFTSRLPDLRVNVKVARKSYFCSKMSVLDEANKIKDYERLLFVEFLEMICRVAMWHFDTAEAKKIPMVDRLALVLDQVLLYKDIQRKDVFIEKHLDSDGDVSDCDY